MSSLSRFCRFFSDSLHDIQRLRNIGISAHIDSGKTTLSERILYYTGRIDKIHEVKGRDGVGAKMDSMDLEREKGITIQSAATYCRWRDHHVNLIDTPGHVDFTIEVERALRVLDSAILVVCAVSGVQSQTITVNRQMLRYNIPRLVFINKLDRAGADPWRAIQDLRKKLGLNAGAVQIPIGLEDNLKGIVDVVGMRAWKFEGSHGENPVEIAVPDVKFAEEKRSLLLECLAEVDETALEIFLDNRRATEADLKAAIRRTTLARSFVPVYMGSAYKNCGVQLLLDGVGDYLPCPSEVSYNAIKGTEEKLALQPKSDEPLVALAFKLEEGRFGQLTYVRIYQGSLQRGSQMINTRTQKRLKVPRLVRMHASEMEDVDHLGAGEIGAIFGMECASGDTLSTMEDVSLEGMHVPEPVMSLAIKPKSMGDGFSRSLQRFLREDPTLRLHTDPDSKETILSGMGELHLEIYLERMKREYNCEVVSGRPKVAYREKSSKPAPFDYLHKKQTGGAGQYARVAGMIEPNDDLSNKFVNEVYGGAVPTDFIPTCEKSFVEATQKGPLIGQPVVGARLKLQDGAYHVVDSNEHAFRTAMLNGFKQGFLQTAPQILEPIMRSTITAPVETQVAESFFRAI